MIDNKSANLVIGTAGLRSNALASTKHGQDGLVTQREVTAVLGSGRIKVTYSQGGVFSPLLWSMFIFTNDFFSCDGRYLIYSASRYFLRTDSHDDSMHYCLSYWKTEKSSVGHSKIQKKGTGNRHKYANR